MKEDYTQVRGDNTPMTDKGASKAGDYTKSLGDANASALESGYTRMGGISGSTKSDGDGAA